MTRNLTGPPARGSDFFNRHADQRLLWDSLHRENVLMLAPRRVGKTSLMLRLQADAAEKGFSAVYLSVADAINEADFVKKIFRAVAELAGAEGVFKRLRKGPAGKFLGRIRRVDVLGVGLELSESAEEHWAILGEALAQTLDSHDGRWLLLIDEIPMFILSLIRSESSSDRARRFLGWFRNLRQAPKERGSLRWLLAGSVGLDTVTARLNLGDTINDLKIFHLGAFDRPDADRLLSELGQTHELPLSTEVRERILDRIGWQIPYYLQLAFSELHEEAIRSKDRDRRPLTPEDVDRAFEALLSPAKRAYFDYWRQRLDEELGRPDAGLAAQILNLAAAGDTGVSREILSQALEPFLPDPLERQEKIQYLLDVLVSDGYLVQEDRSFVFRSPLLLEFWRKRVMP